jgi:acyl-CoA hydrolase
LTFVAIDDSGNPTAVPELVCATDNEQVLQEQAKAERKAEFEALVERLDD